MNLLVQMAWRNIWRNPWRSLVIMFSIALGLFAGFAVLALYKGMMKSRIRTLIETETGHLQLHHPDFNNDQDPKFYINNAAQVVALLKKQQEVFTLVKRTVTQGMLTSTTGSAGIGIYGVIPKEEYPATKLDRKIREGKGFSDEKKPEVIIGKKLADKFKLHLGSRIILTLTDTSGSIVSGAFKVRAIYRSDNAQRDERIVYVPFNILNELLQLRDEPNEISIRLQNNEQTATVVKNLKAQLPGYRIESWNEISPETDLLVRTVDTYSYIIMIIILFALSFGILNTMLMAILERTREMGMMVALGMSRIRLFFIVIIETLLLTFAGTPVGIAVGISVITFYNRKGLDLSSMGKDLMSSFGFETTIYPEFPYDKMTGIIIIVAATALLSAIVPSLKAVRLEPAEALKK